MLICPSRSLQQPMSDCLDRETHSLFHFLSPEPLTCHPTDAWGLVLPMMFQIWEYIIFMGVLWPKIENVLSKVYVVVCILFFVQPLPTTQALAFDYVIYTKKESKNNNVYASVTLKQGYFEVRTYLLFCQASRCFIEKHVDFQRYCYQIWIWPI